MAVSAVVDVVFNLILIPEFGIVGAAVSSVMAFSSAILISIFLGRRVFPMPALPGKRCYENCVVCAVDGGVSCILQFGECFLAWL